MDKAQRAKIQTQIRKANVLESLADLSTSVTQSVKKDVFAGVSKDILSQILGRENKPKKVSADLKPGESLEVGEFFSGKYEENLKLRNQIALERRLFAEEKAINTQKSNELKVKLQALMQEVLALAKTTQSLGEKVEVAAMQAPAQPGIYHLIFFEKLLEFIRNFRKNIESAGTWLQASNKRAEKKNYWSMYKKHGSSFLLSGEHYLQRSAG
jgi:hypothetical protein